MNHDYNDIRSRIDAPVLWWDEHAVPRYCKFHPDKAADIYASEVMLCEIACQNCDRRFRVAFSWSFHGALTPLLLGEHDVKKAIRMARAASVVKGAWAGNWHYGDPPNVDCCSVGQTMNSVPIRVIEVWARDKMVWKRVRRPWAKP